MGRRFRGESVHKVDGKGRVSIPAQFRRVLEEGDPDWTPGANPNLVIIYGRKGRKCLEGYSIAAVESLDDEVEALPRFSPEREMMERMFNTQSIYAQVDENGRIVLPAKLRERIGIDGEAVFAGMGEKFQIWAPEDFGADMEAIDEIVESPQDEADFFAGLRKTRGGG